MKITVYYIFHNCFVVKLPNRTLLFDYPEERMLTPAAQAKVRDLTDEGPLVVFFSHRHGDHFNRNFLTLAHNREHTTFVMAEEIRPLIPDLPENVAFLPSEGCVLLHGMDIKAFPSNDLGAAFLIRSEGINIYFGGDLADWDWEENEPDESAFIQKTWESALQKLRDIRVDLAFSNADARLKNWSGASEFIDKVQPHWFVPMHTFGKPQVLRRFARTLRSLDQVWIYTQTGESWEVEV